MVNETKLDAISIDSAGRLYFDVNDGGTFRSYEFDLSISDLHTLARYAINAARDRLSGGSTILRAMDAKDLP